MIGCYVSTIGSEATRPGPPVDRPPAGRLLTPDAPPVERIEVRTVAVGAVPNPGCERLFLAYGRFRAWMYTEVNAILAPSRLRSDGTDFDCYDAHAVHLAAVATTRAGGTDDVAVERVVGATRLIVDVDDANHPYVAAGLRPGLGRLPVERHFPDLFPPAGPGPHPGLDPGPGRGRVRCEVSRYTAFHPRPGMQRRTIRALRRATVEHFVNLGGDETYAVVEQPLLDLLRRTGVIVHPLGPPRLLPEYGSVNQAVALDLHDLARRMGCTPSTTPPRALTVEADDALRA